MNTNTIHINHSWTLFLDRDGVINRRLVGDYVTRVSDFELLPGALDAIKVFSELFGRVIVITNQQGVAKGLMTKQEVDTVHDFLRKRVYQTGGHIDAIYFCPDWAHERNNCRKPNPKMALQAQKDFLEIDFTKAVMVGDMPTDIRFGYQLGMQTIWIRESPNSQYNGAFLPDFSANSLAEITTLFR